MKNNYKISFLIVTTFLFGVFSAQDRKLNGWIVQGGLGLSRYEKENTFLTNTYSIATFVGKEFPVGKRSSVIPGIKFQTMYGNHSDYAFKSSFIAIPVILRYHMPMQNNSTLFAGFGVENKLKVYEVFNNISSDNSFKGEKGYHFGGIVELGYIAKMSDNIDFIVGLNYTGDFANAGYDNGRYKILDGVNLSLGIKLYREKNE